MEAEMRIISLEIRSLAFNLPLCGGCGESKKQCTIERAAAGINTQLVRLLSGALEPSILCYMPWGCSTSFALSTYNIDAHTSPHKQIHTRIQCECVLSRFRAHEILFEVSVYYWSSLVSGTMLDLELDDYQLVLQSEFYTCAFARNSDSL